MRKGQSGGRSYPKLTPAAAKRIKYLRETTDLTLKQIGLRFDISETTVSKLLRGWIPGIQGKKGG